MIWRRGREQRERDFRSPDSGIIDRHPTSRFRKPGQCVIVIRPVTASNTGPSLDPAGFKAQSLLDFCTKDTLVRYGMAKSDDAR